MNTTVLCVAKGQFQAESIIRQLRGASFAVGAISVVIHDCKALYGSTRPKRSLPAAGTIRHPGIGDFFGGTLRSLSDRGAFVVPGDGYVVAAGPLLAVLRGVTRTASSGDLARSLTEFGIPERDAAVYQRRLHEGALLVSVSARNADEARRAAVIFRTAHADDIFSTGTAAPLRTESLHALG